VLSTLISGLQEIGIDLDAAAIADCLWLALARSAGRRPADGVTPDTLVAAPGEGRANAASRQASRQASPQDSPPVGDMLRDRDKGLQDGGGVSEGERRGRRVFLRRSQALPRSLEIGRSLRALKQAWPRGRGRVLDIEGTISDYAECNILVPRFEPAPERWFDADIVVDDSPTMVVWRDTADELVLVLSRLGAFRALKVWRLQTETGVPILLGDGGNPFSPDTLRDHSGRRLVIVVSDCVSDAWYGTSTWRTLRSWASSNPTVLVNPLPARLWRHTGLDAPAARLRLRTPGGRNREMSFSVPMAVSQFSSSSEVEWLPLPVVRLSPHSLGRWAAMLMRGDPVGCEGVLMASVMTSWAEENAQPLAADELVQGFRLSASAAAWRLAVLCSPQPAMSLSLVRLIQEAMLPQAEVSDLAEFVVSGLLERLDGGQPANELSLRFRDGVRGQLQRSLSRADAVAMHRALSRAGQQWQGEVSRFAVIIGDADGNVRLSEESTPFAEASRAVLSLLAPGVMVAPPASSSRPTGGDDFEETSSERIDAPVTDHPTVRSEPTRVDIPAYVSLLDLLDLKGEQDRIDRLIERWASDDGRLSARLGLGVGGQVSEVSLRGDGPHGLVGGMTGAGKSELLQSLVASLASAHSPRRLTFLLVDYKGGAALKDCVDLPHTVGFVTDLDAHLVDRALKSLRAELQVREHVLRGADCTDLVELERRDSDRAFPSLVIIVDEFAALAAELPDFVDGMVDVAQRGRSLGIHLVLATQRPAGVINDRIRTNTNLRISLPFSDADDSRDIIGTDEAARPGLPTGRAFVRIGPQKAIEFQVAHASAPTPEEGGQRSTIVRELDVEGERVEADAAARTDTSSTSDLERVVEAARGAAARLLLPYPARPWLPELPALLPLSWLIEPDDGKGRRAVALGLVDDPAHQLQTVENFDLDRDGSMLVYGASGSGKTTLLRTIAATLASKLPPNRLHLYGLDFAKHDLRQLAALPHCGGIVAADEPDRVPRLLRMLAAERERRKTLLASWGAESMAELETAGGDALHWIVCLLDGYAGFAATFAEVDRGASLSSFNSLVGDARPLGMSFVVTADRAAVVPPALEAALGRRLVLRMADQEEYAFLGVPRSLHYRAMPPGRGFTESHLEIQCAIVGDDPAGSAQAVAIERLGSELAGRFPATAVPAVGVLLTELSIDSASGDVLELASDEARGEEPISFADVGGQEEARTELETISLAVNQPDAFRAWGARPPRSVLLYGPPGTGKTLLARALAHEAGARFLQVRASDVVSKPFDEAEVQIRSAFDRARAEAPTVIFFDEIDTLAPSRDFAQEATHRIVSTFLENLDGLREVEGVIVLAATNRPEAVYEALLRPGRFDRLVEVPLPDRDDRRAIFRVHMRRAERKAARPLFEEPDEEQWRALLDATNGFSGADVAETVRGALEAKVRSGATAGRVDASELLAVAGSVGLPDPNT
jgi:ATP-dependent 26S proteasome regulatory subunit